jgi:hypothetical protein
LLPLDLGIQNNEIRVVVQESLTPARYLGVGSVERVQAWGYNVSDTAFDVCGSGDGGLYEEFLFVGLDEGRKEGRTDEPKRVVVLTQCADGQGRDEI